MKILVAEDEPSIRLQYKLVLEDRGHKVLATPDGRACVERYSAEMGSGCRPFDLVILDYRMPVLDGLGIAVVSTSKGVLSDRQARKEKLGGELLCRVW